MRRSMPEQRVDHVERDAVVLQKACEQVPQVMQAHVRIERPQDRMAAGELLKS
jgi:hypothetical protein